MEKSTNVFVLTTEYHFLLSMSIIDERYSSIEFKNILIFTGERLSGIIIENLPANVDAVEILINREENFKREIREIIFQHGVGNLFVFIAYRDLETYLLCKIHKSTRRHLVQDGANFYFKILKSVALSRLKETLRIYRNLWMKGIFLKKLILFKKHMAQCGFIDYVWITNPEIYREPSFSRRPLIKIGLFAKEGSIRAFSKYFAMGKDQQYSNYLIYLSSRLTQEDVILREIFQLKSVIVKIGKPNFLIKLHPNSSTIQVDLFKAAFKHSVIKNYVPAELYVAHANASCIIGTASVALFYNNPTCTYFTLIKVYQQLGIFPNWIDVDFPSHVKVIENLDELSPHNSLRITK